MKPVLITCALLALCLLLGGCGETTPAPTATPEPTATPAPTAVPVDIDLASMSSTMRYAQIYEMMIEPTNYAGKTVRVVGQYDAQYDENLDQTYHFVFVADASACCMQGIEFLWNGEHALSEYPAEDTYIELIGTFDGYEELGKTYYAIFVDDIKLW